MLCLFDNGIVLLSSRCYRTTRSLFTRPVALLFHCSLKLQEQSHCSSKNGSLNDDCNDCVE